MPGAERFLAAPQRPSAQLLRLAQAARAGEDQREAGGRGEGVLVLGSQALLAALERCAVEDFCLRLAALEPNGFRESTEGSERVRVCGPQAPLALLPGAAEQLRLPRRQHLARGHLLQEVPVGGPPLALFPRTIPPGCLVVRAPDHPDIAAWPLALAPAVAAQARALELGHRPIPDVVGHAAGNQAGHAEVCPAGAGRVLLNRSADGAIPAVPRAPRGGAGGGLPRGSRRLAAAAAGLAGPVVVGEHRSLRAEGLWLLRAHVDALAEGRGLASAALQVPGLHDAQEAFSVCVVEEHPHHVIVREDVVHLAVEPEV
mmetsp:Transcript_90103/g.285300  ORF Transcript_90103/g.285300 Transcript_90103/m.285300 type:complete len:315 (+) Transcript_90103:387-1331(+)